MASASWPSTPGTTCQPETSKRFGVAAVDLIEAGRWGEITVLRNNAVIGVPIAEAISVYRQVDLKGELVKVARAVGVELGG